MKKKTAKKLGRPPLPKSKKKIVVFARIPLRQYGQIIRMIGGWNRHRAPNNKLTISSWLAQVIDEEISRARTL